MRQHLYSFAGDDANVLDKPQLRVREDAQVINEGDLNEGDLSEVISTGFFFQVKKIFSTLRPKLTNTS